MSAAPLPAPSPALAADTAAAVDFLHRWAPDGPWLLTAIVPDGATETLTFTATGGEGVMTRWIDARQGRKNLYFSVNRPKTLLSKKASKADIGAMLALHADLDVRDGEDREGVLRRLLAYRPEPSVVVFSGGGWQGFWLLDAPVGAAMADEVEARNRQIEADLGADHCHNLDRIMRLPGTVNLPTAKKRAAGRGPALARLVEATWDRRYSLAAFTPAPPLPRPYGDGTAGPAWPRRPLSTRCEDLVRTGDADLYGGDRSSAVFSVAAEMVRCGWTDPEIAAVLADPGNGISAHVREHPGSKEAYALRQARRAREKVGNDASDEAADPRGDAGYEEVLTVAAAPAQPDGERYVADARPPEYSDEALALRFSEKHADDARFVAAWGRWLLWAGSHWQFDATMRAFDLARAVCRIASAEIADPKAANRAAAVAGAKTVAAVVSLARADRRHAATAEQWDPDPWMIQDRDQ